MIQIESVAIRELRGLRELKIEPAGKNFVVSGPNGSGKSGVVDAIQFALTGEMSRLAGKGTAGLSVNRHGPHVDRRDDPASAEVSVRLYLPELQKTALLTRNVKTHKSFRLEPDEPEIREIIEDVADHPELTLSRREIIKYILIEAGQRSKEIQALLKLEAIGHTRGVLKTTSNRLAIDARQAKSAVRDADDALRRHLDVTNLAEGDVLAAVNPYRRTLGLAEISGLEDDTDLSAGVLEGTGGNAFHKGAAIRDIDALQQAQANLSGLSQEAAERLLFDLDTLDADPALLEAVTRRSFVELGVGLIDGPQCPLCDADWESDQALEEHLRAKLAKADEADALQKRLLEHGAEMASQARRIAALVDAVLPLAGSLGPSGLSEQLERCSSDLKEFAKGMKAVDSIAAQRSRLKEPWSMVANSLGDQITALKEVIQSRPDQSALVAAQTFLTRAQDRFLARHAARRQERRREAAREAGRVTYNTYCDVADEYLRELYEAVECNFGIYYREINADDEGSFKARLEPDEGGLGLEVTFYDKGMYPPGAYHSEGHQDGMGVCLYLALMKQLLGDRFRLAVLDDVVMSVDEGHRKEFCRLLKTHFPETQFIITTHDKVWAKQMRTERLVEPTGGVAFHSWSVQTGPVVEQAVEIWDDIESDVEKGHTDVAAGRLRRHLEYVAGELADSLGARLPYRGDFSYDLGDLFPAVIGRHGDLLKLAARAASKWKDEEGEAKVTALKNARTRALRAHSDEAWVVNRAVHYNKWANFTKSEFREVVEAFRGVLAQLRCSACEAWLYITPRRGDPESLRCRCGSAMLNLTLK